MAKYGENEPDKVAGPANTREGMRETFEVAMAAAHAAVPINVIDKGIEDERVFALVPKGFDFRDVTNPDRLSSRIKSAVTFDEKQSLIDYLKRYALAGSIIVADFDTLSASAEIDHHEVTKDDRSPGTAGTVGAMRHKAVLQLRDSEEWKRWNDFEMKSSGFHDQVEFAAFLEENAADVSMPEAATMIEISRDLEAVQNAGFKSSVRLENGDRSFLFETETTTKHDVIVPQKFTLNIPLFQGEPPTEIMAALRWRASGGGIAFGFEWRRVEYVRQAWFRQIVTEVVEETGVPVYFGRR